MDWIDPRHASAAVSSAGKTKSDAKDNKRKRGQKPGANVPKSKPLAKQVAAALSQSLTVWSSAYDHALSRLKWPSGVTPESTFLWSCLMQEQAEVLVRAGMSAKKLATIIAEVPPASDEERASQLAEVSGLMEQSLESAAQSWINTADAFPKSALGLVALAWHLPEHARRAGNEWLAQWLQLVVDRLQTYVPEPEEAVIGPLVLQCELPLLIGLATSASQRTAWQEASRAMDNLAELLERSDDEPGPWLAHGATYLRASLASVVRCRILANALGLRNWYPPQQRSLAGLLKHAARWARPNGTQLLAAGTTSPRTKAMWEALIKQSNDAKSMRGAMHCSGLLTSGDKFGRKLHASQLPPLSVYNSHAAGVVMQSDWRKKGSRCAIDFSDSEICLEVLGPKGQAILAGEWTAHIELDQQAQLQLDEWEEVCWFSDDDVDYLELEAKFGQHARVQRQALFMREARLLLLADALLCDEAGPWSLSARIPLAADVRYEPTAKTTEGVIITASDARCVTLPLHLPEWRQQVQGGTWSADGDALVAQQRVDGTRAYVAGLFSLGNTPAKLPYTWRHLTVGEDLRIVGPREAVAFRVQLGKSQWIFYRSLTQPKRRTALGMHTVAEFYAGSFDGQTGNIETLLEVEPTS